MKNKLEEIRFVNDSYPLGKFYVFCRENVGCWFYDWTPQREKRLARLFKDAPWELNPYDGSYFKSVLFVPKNKEK